MKRILLSAALAVALPSIAWADAGHSSGEPYGEPGDSRKPARIVQIVMREADERMEFVPKNIKIRRGQQIKFVIRNNGEMNHEIVIGTLEGNLKHGAQMAKNPDMEHDDPNMRRLVPKASDSLIWKFTKAGEFDFSCLIPGHREAGMSGTIIVQ
ncbi:copper tolerance protein [Kaistia sp. 32K]|uniref:cupredoxin domain-containing protein n=1 Tax=Kaistia sp. 32K TaxID=2795690 RepID=UPI0019167917|nr:cupredoxin family protein [Kaistia sp. 32K]BCP56102.1 copper tolerance protein [Kaistia sp. 32K]